MHINIPRIWILSFWIHWFYQAVLVLLFGLQFNRFFATRYMIANLFLYVFLTVLISWKLSEEKIILGNCKIHSLSRNEEKNRRLPLVPQLEAWCSWGDWKQKCLNKYLSGHWVVYLVDGVASVNQSASAAVTNVPWCRRLYGRRLDNPATYIAVCNNGTAIYHLASSCYAGLGRVGARRL